MSKIEIMNATTGEVIHMDAETTIGSLIGPGGYDSATDLAEAIKPSVKGVSAEKIADIIAVLMNKENDFFDGVKQLRDGENPKSFRLVVEEVGRATKAEAQEFCENIERTPGGIEAVAKSIDEPEAVTTEQNHGPDEDAKVNESSNQGQEPEEKGAEPSPSLDEIKSEGANARASGSGPDDNPHDGGTDEFNAWADGWKLADGQVKMIIEDGRKTALAGLEKSENGAMRFRAGTDARSIWDQGFAQGKEESGNAEKSENPAPEDESTPHGEGRAAFMFGKNPDQNPYEPGLKRNKEWAEGFNEAEAEANT